MFRFKKGVLIFVFSALAITGIIIDTMYDSGEISIAWEYLAVVLGYVAVFLVFYDLFVRVYPKIRKIYDDGRKKKNNE